MYSQILDQKTYAAVVNAAPSVAPSENAHIAQEVVNILANISMDEFPNAANEQGNQCWKIRLSELSEKLGGKVSAAKIGRVLDELGLVKSRLRDGYYVYWNLRQVDILRKAFQGYRGER